MILTPLLLMAGNGIRVTIAGEGKLRFAVGRKTLAAASATLSANAQGLLADEAGRPVAPAIRVGSDAFRVAMNGTVTVSGKVVSRLVLERPGKDAIEFGYPGEEGFGIVQVVDAKPAAKALVPATTTPKTVPVATKATETGAPAQIVVRAATDILGDRITLADIADLTGDASTVARLGKIDLGTVPTLESRRHLGIWTLTSAVRNAGFRDGSFKIQAPADVTIGRKGQTIDTASLVKLATEKAQELAGTEAVLSLAPQPLRAPLGETKLDAVAARQGETEVVNVQIEITVDGKSIATRTVGFRAKVLGIKIGDALRVTVTMGGATVQTDAKAKTAGKIGSTIQVVTADGAVMTATVTGPGSAEVKL